MKKETDKRTRGRESSQSTSNKIKKNDKFKFGQSGTQFIYG